MQKCTAPGVRPSKSLPLSFGQHAAKGALHFFAVLRRVIPVDSALQTIAEEHFRLPSEQFLRHDLIGSLLHCCLGDLLFICARASQRVVHKDITFMTGVFVDVLEVGLAL